MSQNNNTQSKTIDFHFDVYVKKGKFYITNDYNDCILELTKKQALDLIELLAKAFLEYKNED